ncbi:F-actin capping protein beta subunit [Meredithblackwellia eburnea MCA 4105]
MTEEDTLSSVLDLCRRLPPNNIAHNLDLLVTLLPDIADDLLSSVDQPLKVQRDKDGRDYLVCDYNRDGDSYRSPWSNTYDPPLSDGTSPSPKLRLLEQSMNDAFDVYRDMYYEGGVSSVYLWDLDDGFAGVVLLKKDNNTSQATSSWDSVHVFEVTERQRTAHYKLTSTVMLYMVHSPSSSSTTTTTTKKDEVALGGSMTRQDELDGPLDPQAQGGNAQSHVANVGRFVESMEIKMRNLLQDVYFSKTKDIVNTLRSSSGLSEARKRNALQGELVGLLGMRNKAPVVA